MFQNDAKRQETCLECDFELFRGVCGVCGRGGRWLVAGWAGGRGPRAWRRRPGLQNFEKNENSKSDQF